MEPKKLLATILFCLMFASFANAQTKVEIGEDVYVFFLGQWRPGVVVAKKGRKIQVEYTFVSAKRDIFQRRGIRKLNELNALDYSRKWSSANGKFEILGALTNVLGTDRIVITKEDESELEVDLKKLCDKDNKYVNKLVASIDKAALRGEVPARTPRLPEIESFDQEFGAHGSFNSSATGNVEALGGLPKYMRRKSSAQLHFRTNITRWIIIRDTPCW